MTRTHRPAISSGFATSAVSGYPLGMDRPYVDWVRVEGYRCIKSVDLHLTPLHAFIGPNDSGKSSLLEAIKHGLGVTFWVPPHGHASIVSGAILAAHGNYPSKNQGAMPANAKPAVFAAIEQRQLLRLDPDDLRGLVPLIPKGNSVWFQNERGLGLASVYDALLSRNRAAFTLIEERFRGLFPTVKALRLENANQNTKTMGITLFDGGDVGPKEMSEGMLYWLAFAIIEHIAPTGILLIEEPENGLHPSRIAEVMKVLREVSKRTQIILATHSPLVINELKPEEVTVVTRPDGATSCKPMSETKNFAERSKVYALGELWLSYADGDLERELVEPNSEAAKAG